MPEGHDLGPYCRELRPSIGLRSRPARVARDVATGHAGTSAKLPAAGIPKAIAQDGGACLVLEHPWAAHCEPSWSTGPRFPSCMGDRLRSGCCGSPILLSWLRTLARPRCGLGGASMSAILNRE